MSLSTQAVDELDIFISGFSESIQMFFRPFYPDEITQDLCEDFTALS